MIPSPKLSRAIAPLNTRLKVIGPSVGCFVVACATPALILDGKAHLVIFGAQAWVQGPLAVFIGQFAWLANLIWLLAVLLVMLSRFKGAAIVSVIGFAVANHVWALFGQDIPGDEGGVTRLYLSSFHVGFYLWLLSFLILAVRAFLARNQDDAIENPWV